MTAAHPRRRRDRFGPGYIRSVHIKQPGPFSLRFKLDVELALISDALIAFLCSFALDSSLSLLELPAKNGRRSFETSSESYVEPDGRSCPETAAAEGFRSETTFSVTGCATQSERNKERR